MSNTPPSPSLSPQELEQVGEFSLKIDFSQGKIWENYGISPQNDLAQLTNQVHRRVSAQELSPIADLLQALSPEKPKLFQGKKNLPLNQGEIREIALKLEEQQVLFMKDSIILGQLLDTNQRIQKELTMYLLAGEQALARPVPEEDSPNHAFFQEKLHELAISRQISQQLALQTRQLQENTEKMLEKIQFALVNTIPLWKSQFKSSQ